MIDFYAGGSPNARKIFIMLEELELPYNMIFIDVWKGENFTREFHQVTPNDKIPVIVDHDLKVDGKPYTVIELGAILMYLADKTGRFLPKETAPRYEVIQWLMLQMGSIGPMFGQFVHFKGLAPAGNDYAFSRYQTEVRRLYDVLEERLGKVPYVGGADYSIADIAVFPWAFGHNAHNVPFDDKPNLNCWFTEIAARPAIDRANKKANALPNSRPTADPDVVDRFLGRGRYARL